jgi:hypothetical protein
MHNNEAHNLGLAVRTDIQKVDGPLNAAGVALGLTPSDYGRIPSAV